MLGRERIVNVPGDALLTPQSEPIFPAELAQDEKVIVYPPVVPWVPKSSDDVIALMENPHLQDQRYWLLKDAYERHPRGGEWLNQPPIGNPYGRGQGLAACPDVCTFQYPFRKQSLGRFPDYHDYDGGVSIVSTRLLDILRRIDAECIDSRNVRLVDKSGVGISDQYHLVDFTRKVKAVDYANSVVTYHGPTTYAGQTYAPWVESWQSVRMLEQVVATGFIFRHISVYGVAGIFVPRAIKDMVGAVRPKITNVGFENPAFGI